jgi:predicted transcriptional regulator
MNPINLWPTADEVRRALEAQYEPAMDKVARQAGLEPAEYGVLLAARTLEPKLVASWNLRVRGPYTAAGRYEERLRKAAVLGHLKAVHEGEYRLTELGRRTVQHILDAANKAMSRLDPMPPADLDRLDALVSRLVDASLQAPEPPGKWCINLSRRLDSGQQAHPVVRIDQHLSDLSAYRDDSHVAAWRPSELDAKAWEAFTCIWRGDARSLDDLFQKLERRGHSREDYDEALNDLVQRSLVKEDAGSETYQITRQGQTLRQKAEDTTDTYFYGPWKVLGNGDVEELRGLLERLCGELTKKNARA